MDVKQRKPGRERAIHEQQRKPGREKAINEERRWLIPSLVLGGAGLVLSQGFRVKAQAVPVKIADLETLDKDFAAQPFEFARNKCVLIRLPADYVLKKGRGLEVQNPQRFLLTAYTRVCTHSGCTPAMPDSDHRSPKGEPTIVCPCHGSVFAADGSVVHGPAERALQAVALEVKDAAVFAIGLVPDPA